MKGCGRRGRKGKVGRVFIKPDLKIRLEKKISLNVMKSISKLPLSCFVSFGKPFLNSCKLGNKIKTFGLRAFWSYILQSVNILPIEIALE